MNFFKQTPEWLRSWALLVNPKSHNHLGNWEIQTWQSWCILYYDKCYCYDLSADSLSQSSSKLFHGWQVLHKEGANFNFQSLQSAKVHAKIRWQREHQSVSSKFVVKFSDFFPERRKYYIILHFTINVIWHIFTNYCTLKNIV